MVITKDGVAGGQHDVGSRSTRTAIVSARSTTASRGCIYQIPLVDMPNPNGLMSLDSQTYQPSHDSGSFFLWNAGDGPTGDIVAFAREE